MLVMGFAVAQAQNALPRTFEYDDAGNRTARKTLELKAEVVAHSDAQTAVSEVRSTMYEEALGENLTVKIYPNPTKGQVTLQFSQDVKQGFFQLYNMSGNKVFDGNFSAGMLLVDLSPYPAGTYLLYLSADGQRDTWRVVKN